MRATRQWTKREREKIDEEITRIKKYFNVAIKINFVCCILIWCTLCLVSFSKQWNTRKKELEEREFVWFGGVFTVCHLELRRMKAPNQPKVTVHNEMCSDSWRFLKCDNGTSQVHGNWTKRRAHTPYSQCKRRKRKETPIPKCFAVAFGGWIFICRYCALNGGGGVVLDKFLHTVCDYVWYFSTLANNSHGLVSQV